MDVAKELRTEADRLHRLANDIERGKDEAAGFTIQVVNPNGKIVVTWDVTQLEKVPGNGYRYVAGWKGSGSGGVYAKVCGLGAGTL